MKITKFFIVTKPNVDSELGDICFEADVQRLQLQFLGGLDHSDIVAVFDNEEEAENLALDLLHEIQGDIEDEYIC